MRMRARLGALLLAAAACGDDADGGPVLTGLCAEVPEGRVSLPADDAHHPGEEVEWWYWTGHLDAADGRRFGFEWAFFVQDGTLGVAQMGHHAITDVTGARFDDAVAFGLGAPADVDDGFDLIVGRQRAVGGGGRDVLHGEAGPWTLDLELEALKAPVLQHGDGYTEYPFGGYTYYYSRERMRATGVLRRGDEAVEVTGLGWFDHQWGALAAAVADGWDWFALQLDDDREIMLFVVRADEGPLLVGGSLSQADCTQVELAPEDVEITATGSWTSPVTGCTYPQGWELRLGELALTVTPVLADQELVNPVETYWEGAADVTGSAAGRAYVELTGYCDAAPEGAMFMPPRPGAARRPAAPPAP